MITVCNANVTKADLNEVQVVTPERAGRVWRGIKHADLIDSMEHQIYERGWQINNQQFSLSDDRADLVGAFGLTIPGMDAPEGIEFSLGFMTSNNLRRSLRLYVGSRIFVCNNGCVTGELVLRHKHTSRFDLRSAMSTAMSLYFERIGKTKRMIEGWKTTPVFQPMINHILMEAGRQHIMPWSRIGKVDDEFRNPTYADHAEKTSWGLYNAFTHIVKQSPVHTQMDQMNRFRELLPSNVY